MRLRSNDDLAELTRAAGSALGAVRRARRRRERCRLSSCSTQLIGALTELSGELLELSLLQARARLDAITFETVDLTPEQGYCIASRHRRDWMNARAELVDSWRLITFNADDLQSDLDFVFSGDIGNVGDNPFGIRGNNGRLRVGLEFDAPLTRLAERNIYRQSLIEYQQARRDYYQFRDGVHARHPQHAAADAGGPVELRAAAGGGAHGDHAGRPGAAAAFGAGPAGGGGRPGHAAGARRGVAIWRHGGPRPGAGADRLAATCRTTSSAFGSTTKSSGCSSISIWASWNFDANGQRIEHTQPLARFVDDWDVPAPFELPAPCDEATADMPESPDESGMRLCCRRWIAAERDEPDDGEEVLPPPMRTQSQRLPLSRFGVRK